MQGVMSSSWMSPMVTQNWPWMPLKSSRRSSRQPKSSPGPSPLEKEQKTWSDQEPMESDAVSEMEASVSQESSLEVESLNFQPYSIPLPSVHTMTFPFVQMEETRTPETCVKHFLSGPTVSWSEDWSPVQKKVPELLSTRMESSSKCIEEWLDVTIFVIFSGSKPFQAGKVRRWKTQPSNLQLVRSLRVHPIRWSLEVHLRRIRQWYPKWNELFRSLFSQSNPFSKI